jgi:hypothetical protein
MAIINWMTSTISQLCFLFHLPLALNKSLRMRHAIAKKKKSQVGMNPQIQVADPLDLVIILRLSLY